MNVGEKDFRSQNLLELLMKSFGLLALDEHFHPKVNTVQELTVVIWEEFFQELEELCHFSVVSLMHQQMCQLSWLHSLWLSTEKGMDKPVAGFQ